MLNAKNKVFILNAIRYEQRRIEQSHIRIADLIKEGCFTWYELVRCGEKIEAIKKVRHERQCSIKEAKTIVDNYIYCLDSEIKPED